MPPQDLRIANRLIGIFSPSRVFNVQRTVGVLGRHSKGEYAYFQLITQAIDYRFEAEEYLALPAGNMVLEMHPLSQASIFGILASLDFEVLEVRVDASGDAATTISNVFFARRCQS